MVRGVLVFSGHRLNGRSMDLNQIEHFLRVAELGSINRAAKEKLQIGWPDKAMHDLTLVQSRRPEGAARRRCDLNEFVERASGSADGDAAVLLGHIAERWKQIRWSAAPGLRLEQIPHERQIFR